uniref:Uncharacterized protein n=1 Tax=Salmo trutta TaxID=8032 RepID=A0A674B7X2_SALTR
MEVVTAVEHFMSKNLVTCTLAGWSDDQSCVLPGCSYLVHHMKEQRWQVVLINRDLCEKYRHLGFNNKTDISHMTDKLDLNSLILVNGEASERLTQHCLRHCILVVDRVKPAILKDFAETTGAVPVTYATQLSKHCVGTEVEVSMWRDCSGNGRRASMAVNIFADCNALVTVVLTSSVHGKLQALTGSDRNLLPGAGTTEFLCVHHLQKHIEDNGLSLDTHFSRLLLIDDTEDGLMSQYMKHSAGKVYDNVTLKLEAWRKALDFVFLVLQTEIITELTIFISIGHILTDCDGCILESKLF